MADNKFVKSQELELILNANKNYIVAELAKKANTFDVGEGLKLENGQLDLTIDHTLYKIVTEKPTTAPAKADANKIHLVANSAGSGDDTFTEYIWNGSKWEQLGSFKADFDSANFKKELLEEIEDKFGELEDSIEAKAAKTDALKSVSVTNNGAKLTLTTVSGASTTTDIPTASSTSLGFVKSVSTGTGGTDYNVQVNIDGTMKVNVPGYKISKEDVEGVLTGTIDSHNHDGKYALASLATTYTGKDKYGLVKVGENINVSTDGVISVTFPEQKDYELPTASASVKGGVKVGSGLSIDSTTYILSVDTNSIATHTWVEGLGYQTAANVRSILSQDGYVTETNIANVVNGISVVDDQISYTVYSGGTPKTVTNKVNNVERATNATNATNLAAAPSLAYSGNTITVTAGNKTSEAFTVPYATKAGSADSATKATDADNATKLNGKAASDYVLQTDLDVMTDDDAKTLATNLYGAANVK